ncbi:hypothetical protein DXG03_003067, partial [Asterophora parasitica]
DSSPKSGSTDEAQSGQRVSTQKKLRVDSKERSVARGDGECAVSWERLEEYFMKDVARETIMQRDRPMKGANIVLSDL